MPTLGESKRSVVPSRLERALDVVVASRSSWTIQTRVGSGMGPSCARRARADHLSWGMAFVDECTVFVTRRPRWRTGPLRCTASPTSHRAAPTAATAAPAAPSSSRCARAARSVVVRRPSASAGAARRRRTRAKRDGARGQRSDPCRARWHGRLRRATACWPTSSARALARRSRRVVAAAEGTRCSRGAAQPRAAGGRAGRGRRRSGPCASSCAPSPTLGSSGCRTPASRRSCRVSPPPSPKIADYPFTTLTPNLGVAGGDGDRFVVADIPGLVEGAAEGRGLGHRFLRHVVRCRALVLVVDLVRGGPRRRPRRAAGRARRLRPRARRAAGRGRRDEDGSRGRCTRTSGCPRRRGRWSSRR